MKNKTCKNCKYWAKTGQDQVKDKNFGKYKKGGMFLPYIEIFEPLNQNKDE